MKTSKLIGVLLFLIGVGVAGVGLWNHFHTQAILFAQSSSGASAAPVVLAGSVIALLGFYLFASSRQ